MPDPNTRRRQGIYRDPPRTRAQSKVKLNSKLLDAILSTSDDAVVVISPSGVIVRWNPAAERLLGYEAAEIIGQPSRLILPQAWWCYIDERLAELKRGTVVHCDSVRRHKDGSLVDVEATTSALFDDKGAFLGYFNVFRDLKRKREQDLANAFLASIVRASPDAIASTDVDLRLLTWNTAAEHMFGYSASEVIGEHVGKFVPALIEGDSLLHLDHKSHARLHRLETCVHGRNGSPIMMSVVVSALRNAAGVPTGWSITCTDITERKRQEEHSKFIMRELSHRAKNLLAVIMAMFRSLADSKHSIAEFEEEFSSRLKGLAKSHDLLVQSGWAGASLHHLVEAQLKPFVGNSSRLRIVGTDVKLGPAAVQSVGLALHELGTNAAKYGALSSPSGRIEVETTHAAEHVEILWKELEGPPVKAPSRSGFGQSVIEDMICDSIGGSAKMEFPESGVRWSARIPKSLIAA